MSQSKKSIIVGLLCFLIAISGILISTNSSVLNLPVMKLALDDEIEDQFNEMIEEIEDELDNADDDEIEEFEDETGIKIEKFVKLFSKPSLNNYIKLVNILEDVDGDKFGTGDFDADAEDVKIFGIIRTVIVVYGLFVALLSLLGALLKKRVFSVLAIIFSLLYFFALVSVVMGIIFIVFSVAHIVILTKDRKSIAVQ